MKSENEVRRVSPEEAFALTSDGYEYIDVRTADEFGEGHPKGAINVPYDLHATTEKQADFVASILRNRTRDQKICIGCHSGIRSLAAARLLIENGFTNVVEQRAGWDGARGNFGELTEPGWRKKNLPRE